MGFFRKLRRKAVSIGRKVKKVVRAPVRKVRKIVRAPVRKVATRIRTAIRKIKKAPVRRTTARRKAPTPKPRVTSRRTATKKIPIIKTPKKINKKSISIFDKLKSATGRALSQLKKVNPVRPSKILTSIQTAIKKIKLTQPKIIRLTRVKRKEDVKGKKTIFFRIKSISKKLITGIKQNYILPVGFGVAKAQSVRSDVVRKFFGGAKKVIGGLVKATPLYQLSNPNSTLRSKIGDWFAKKKIAVEKFKKKGLIDTVVDFFKGEGVAEQEREEAQIELEEEREMQTQQEQERSKLIRNVAIVGGVATLGLLLLKRKA